MTIQVTAENIASIIPSFEQLTLPSAGKKIAFLDAKKNTAINGVSGVWLNVKVNTDIKLTFKSQTNPLVESTILTLVLADKYFEYKTRGDNYSPAFNIGVLVQQQNDFEIILHAGVEYYLTIFHLSNDFLKTYFNHDLSINRSFEMDEKAISLVKSIARQKQVNRITELALMTELFFTSMSQLTNRKEISTEIDYAKIERVKDHLLSHLKDHQPSLDSLEQIAGMSKSSLKTKFKKYEKVSVQKYFLREKMKLAIQLISEGTSIKATSIKLGYSSTAGFSNAFKKVIGLSPSQFILKK